MSMMQPDLLSILPRCRSLIDAVLQQTVSAAQRASLLTGMLRDLWPSSLLYGCLLRAEGEEHLNVRDEAGNPRPEWADLLHTRLTGSARTQRKAPRPAKLPRAMKLPDHTLVVEPIAFGDYSVGTLVLALPEGASSNITSAAQILLATCAGQLAMRLCLEACTRELHAQRAELAEQAALADVGALASPVMHEFNNFLNVVSLHLAVLELDVPEDLRQDLADIRRQQTTITALVQEFQQYRQRRRPTPQPVDLHHVPRGVIQELSQSQPGSGPCVQLTPVAADKEGNPPAPGSVPVSLDLAPQLALVLGLASDLKRLCTFLLRNAVTATAPAGGAISVRTEVAADRVLLRIDDVGPNVAPASLEHVFDARVGGRSGTNCLELAACQTLVERLQGTLRAANRPEGGLAVHVELPTP